MPIYKPETNAEEWYTTHKFIYRVYKDGERQRRVYKDGDLVYSLYDVNYHYGQSGDTEGEEESGAYIPEGQKIVKNDVWGHTTELNTVEYDDGDNGILEFWEWYKGIVDSNNSTNVIDNGFVDTAKYLGFETEKDNKEDYDLYVDLMRTSWIGNQTIEWSLEFGEGATYDEAVDVSDFNAYEAGAYAITGHKVTSY